MFDVIWRKKPTKKHTYLDRNGLTSSKQATATEEEKIVQTCFIINNDKQTNLI